MSHRILFSSLLALMLGAVSLQAARPTTLDPELYGTWEPSWTALLPPAVSNAQVFRVYQLNLLAAEQAGDAVKLHRLGLGPKGFDDRVLAALSTEGLPKKFTLADLQISAVAGKVAIVDGERVYTAPISPKAEIGEWKKLEDVPLKKGEKIVRLAVNEGYLLVLTDRPMVDDTVRNAGWMANLEAPGKTFRWIELPPTPKGREGYVPLMAKEALLLGGGRPHGAAPDVRRGEVFLDSLPLKGPEVGAWTLGPVPVFESIPNAVGASYGSGMYLADRTPRALKNSDQPTSQSLFLAFDLRDGRVSPWRKIFLPQAPAPVRAMTVDPGHNQLLMLREGNDGGLLVTALPLPESAQGTLPNMTDVRRAAERQVASRVQPQKADTILDEAKKVGMPAVLAISTDDNASADVRARMTTPRFRYMTMGSVPGFLGAEDARAAAKKYGVKKEPAFLLVDPQSGKEISRHEGSFPTDAELMRFTSPIRQPSTQGAKP